ncbi:MAG: hypothetical protein KAV87_31375 [Desulfobacteraceae bacterium]|nr:hypothetical protein [Desulfobacteraceae bacterium]
MTSEQIEEALEQPEHGNRLLKLAKARIALENAIEDFDSATNPDEDLDDCTAVLDVAQEFEQWVFEDIALPFFPTDSITQAIEIIQDHYKGIKARLLKPENRIREALS